MRQPQGVILGLLVFNLSGCVQTMEPASAPKCPTPDASFPTVKAHLNEMIQDYNNHSVTAFERYSDPNVKITRVERGGNVVTVSGKTPYINFLGGTFRQLDPKWEDPCIVSVEQARDLVKAVVRYTFYWHPPNENYTRDPGLAILYFTPEPEAMFVDGTFLLRK
jgi:hypothetical protein